MMLKIFGKEILQIERAIDTKGFSEDYRRLINAALDGESPDIYSITQNNAYEKHVWVFACINVIARNCARAILEFTKEGSEDVIEDKRLKDLFYNSDLNYAHLIEGIMNYLLTNGNAFLKLDNESGILTGMHLLNSDYMVPITKNNIFIGYCYAPLGMSVSYAPEQIIHFKTFNPNSLAWGLSPVKAILLTLRQNQKARNFNDSTFENGSAIGLFFKTNKALTDAQFERFNKDIENRTRGIKRANAPYLLDDGMDVADLKLTATDMAYIEQMKWSREEILAAFGVPPQTLGITEKVNRSNADTSQSDFWYKILIPALNYMKSTFKHKLLNTYFPGTDCRFNLSEIQEIKEDETNKATIALAYYNMGIPIQAINENLNLGFTEDDLKNAIPKQSTDYSMPEEKPAKEDDEDEPIKRLAKTLEKMNFKSPETIRKETIWKRFDNGIRKIEYAYQRKVSRFLYELRGEILSNFIGKGYEPAGKKSLFDIDKQKAKIEKISKPFFEQALAFGGMSLLEDMSITDITFSVQNVEAQNYLRVKENKIKGIVDTIQQRIEKRLIDGLKSGSTKDEIADSIREFFNGADSRADVIAQTEILGAANNGRMVAMQEAGIRKKEWINSQDDKVRDSHRIHDGAIGINEKFSNGLEMPHDPNGPPEEIINCRCLLNGVVL